MLREGLNLMSPEDFREYSAIKRRMEFLELRASHLWKYRQANIERAYADVKDGLKLTPITTTKEEDEK
jgi:hypothetical protein